MAENWASRGVPLPSAGQILAIAAALLAAWLVWSKYGRTIEDADDARGGASGTDGPAVESYLNKGADALPELLAALDSDDPADRRRAAYSLGHIGPAAGDALEKLRARLADDNPDVRAYAAYAVARIEPDQEAAAAAIAPLLTDPQQSVREDACKELLAIGSPAFKSVLNVLLSEDASVRLTVVRALKGTRDVAHYRGWRRRHPHVLQALRGLLDSANPDVRVEVLSVLAEWNEATPAEVGELLRNDDAQRIYIALQAIVLLKVETAGLLPDIVILIDRLKLQEAGAASGRGVDPMLQSVLSALMSLQAAARPAVPRLLKLSGKCTVWTQLEIARTLATIGADPDEITGILVPLLLVQSKRGPSVSWRAGELLLQISPEEARRQVSLLIPKLAAADGTVDNSVLNAFHALGPQAQAALPALIPLLQNSDSQVVELAAMTLARLGNAGSSAAPDLAGIVNNTARPVAHRILCASALSKMQEGARSTVPSLLQSITQGEPKSFLPSTGDELTEWHVRAAIIRALGSIAGDDAPLVSVLHSQLSSRSPDVRAAAAEALGRAVGGSSAVLGKLVERLGDGDPQVRATAALAIGRMTVERGAAVAPLIRALLDEDHFVHSAAAVALGNIGPAAGDALPMLREILADPRTMTSAALETSGNPELDSLSFARSVNLAIEAISGASAISAQ